MKKSYISDYGKQIPVSGIGEFFDVATRIPDAVSLGIGEPDFETPLHVRQVAIENIQQANTKYTANPGMMELRQAVGDYLNQKFSLSYDPQSQIMITVGASEGIDLALRATVNPGEEVLVVEPSYVSYAPCVTLCGGIPVSIPTKAENEFRLTAEELKNAITPNTKALILPFPNNPTGAIMEKKDLEALREILIEQDILVISDEIYAELTYGQKHVSIASLDGMYERTIVLKRIFQGFRHDRMALRLCLRTGRNHRHHE